MIPPPPPDGVCLPDLLVAMPARSLACAAGARLRPLQALKLLRCAHLVVELVQNPHNSGGEGREYTWVSRRTARRFAAFEEADCKQSTAPASQPTAEALASADPSEWPPSVLVNPTLVRVAKQALCFVLSVHVLACGYTALGQQFAADSGDDGDDDAEATADDGADVVAWAFRAVKRINVRARRLCRSPVTGICDQTPCGDLRPASYEADPEPAHPFTHYRFGVRALGDPPHVITHHRSREGSMRHPPIREPIIAVWSPNMVPTRCWCRLRFKKTTGVARVAKPHDRTPVPARACERASLFSPRGPRHRGTSPQAHASVSRPLPSRSQSDRRS